MLRTALYLPAMNLGQRSLLLFLGLPVALAAQPCTKPGWNPNAPPVIVAQAQLMGVKLRGEMDEAVPDDLQAKILTMKDALDGYTFAQFECVQANDDPISIEGRLAGPLSANQPEKQETYDPRKPPQLDQIYGSDLRVKVTRPGNEPQLVLVEYNFGIDCGFDSVLLTYERSGGAWKQVLRWQSPAYDTVIGAFGDFFDYQVLPQSDGKSWLIAVVHGRPWCTSNWSAFDVDLLQPSADDAPPHNLFHKEFFYRRDWGSPMIGEPRGFEFRMRGNSIDPSVGIRPVIYRFEQEGNNLVRIQPIAVNGRDFVDEWLQSPWSDAARWSAAPTQSNLKQTQKMVMDLQDSKNAPLMNFGPVRGCADSKAHYQVELDEEWVDGKGNPRSSPTTYFQIEEGNNSFTTLSAGPSADPHCTGPDIMPKH